MTAPKLIRLHDKSTGLPFLLNAAMLLRVQDTPAGTKVFLLGEDPGRGLAVKENAVEVQVLAQG